MEIEIINGLYQQKKDAVSFDHYVGQVQNGLDLLKTEGLKKTMEYNDLEAMNAALEYNMELMLKHLI